MAGFRRIPAIPQLGAERFSADDQMDELGIDLWDAEARADIERAQRAEAYRLLDTGRVVVVEWGTWSRSERDVLRAEARYCGAAVELRFLDAPVDELWRRVAARGRESPPITLDDVVRWSAMIERPTEAELRLFDPSIVA